MVIEIADCGCSSICIREFSEAKPFWLACIVVVDKSKVQDLTNLAEYMDDLFFREAWTMSMLFHMSVKVVSNHKEYSLRQAESANFLHF